MYRNAYKRVVEIANGDEFKGAEKQARLRRQIDWMYALEQKYREVAHERLTIQAILSQPEEGVAPPQ